MFDLRPNYGGGNEDNGDLLHKVPCSYPNPAAGYCQATPLLETPGHSPASLDKSVSTNIPLSGCITVDWSIHPLKDLLVASTSWKLCVRKRRGKKEPPLRTVDEGLCWAVALGQNFRRQVSEETKGVCEVWGVGRGFIGRAGVQARSSHIRKKARGYSGGWCPRAPCRYLIGPGCRGSVSGTSASLRNFVCGIFPGHASTCPTFHYGKSCYKHLHLSFCMDISFQILWGKNTGVGCHSLFQGIFPTQGSPRSSALQADSLPSLPPGT